MPTYEYMCEKCEHEFEREQRISDPPVKTCPKCRSRKVKKLISRTSFVLKGGGWYSDLYSSSQAKNGGKDSESKTESGSESKTESSSESKTESSSETKTESKSSDSKKSKSSKGSSSSGSKKGKSAA